MSGRRARPVRCDLGRHGRCALVRHCLGSSSTRASHNYIIRICRRLIELPSGRRKGGGLMPMQRDWFSQAARFFDLLSQPGDVREDRAPKHNQWGHTPSGYFDSPNALVHSVLPYDGKANIYVSVNPVDCALLARANNRTLAKASCATVDENLLRRIILLSTGILLTWAIAASDVAEKGGHRHPYAPQPATSSCKRPLNGAGHCSSQIGGP